MCDIVFLILLFFKQLLIFLIFFLINFSFFFLTPFNFISLNKFLVVFHLKYFKIFIKFFYINHIMLTLFNLFSFINHILHLNTNIIKLLIIYQINISLIKSSSQDYFHLQLFHILKLKLIIIKLIKLIHLMPFKIYLQHIFLFIKQLIQVQNYFII